MSTIGKLDLKSEDFVLNGLMVSDVQLLDRSKDGKANLIFIKFVGSKKFGASPSMLYFGDLEFPQLVPFRGQKVDVLLRPSDKGFTVDHIQPSLN